MNTAERYTIRAASEPPSLKPSGACPIWEQADSLTIDDFLEKSSDVRPQTTVRVMHRPDALYIWFQVLDRCVRSVRTETHSDVCKDSCVEFFMQPKLDLPSYFNLELNAGGTVLIFHCQKIDGKRVMDPFPPELVEQITIRSSLPTVVDPEITTQTEWWIRVRLPLAVFEPYIGSAGELPGQTWRGNFYKCASDLSHPHWGSWQPQGPVADFHRPEIFGPLDFA